MPWRGTARHRLRHAEAPSMSSCSVLRRLRPSTIAFFSIYFTPNSIDNRTTKNDINTDATRSYLSSATSSIASKHLFGTSHTVTHGSTAPTYILRILLGVLLYATTCYKITGTFYYRYQVLHRNYLPSTTISCHV